MLSSRPADPEGRPGLPGAATWGPHLWEPGPRAPRSVPCPHLLHVSVRAAPTSALSATIHCVMHRPYTRQKTTTCELLSGNVCGRHTGVQEVVGGEPTRRVQVPLSSRGVDHAPMQRTRGARDTQEKDRGHCEQSARSQDRLGRPPGPVPATANPSTTQVRASLNKTRTPFPHGPRPYEESHGQRRIPSSSAPAALPLLSPEPLTHFTRVPSLPR